MTRVWNHTDQSIPSSKRSLLERRGTSQPLVQGIALTTDFASTNTSQYVLSPACPWPRLENLFIWCMMYPGMAESPCS